MTNNIKVLSIAIAFSAASLVGCGDSNSTSDIDAGKVVITARDGSTAATGTDSGSDQTDDTDGGVSAGNDGGATTDGGTPSDCFTGTPVKQEDFLNRCTKATTTTKKAVIPLAATDGTPGAL